MLDIKQKRRVFRGYKKNREIEHPTLTDVNAVENSVFFESNGMPFIVDIYYRGKIFITTHLGVHFRIVYKDTRIRIINLFRQKFPEKLFDFNGDMDIKTIRIITYGGTSEIIKKPIPSGKYINIQDTKLEDDDLIIRDEIDFNYYVPKSGYNRPKLNKNTLSSSGIYQKMEILDKNQIKTMVKDYVDRYKTKLYDGKTIQSDKYSKLVKPAKKVKTKKVKKGGY